MIKINNKDVNVLKTQINITNAEQFYAELSRYSILYTEIYDNEKDQEKGINISRIIPIQKNENVDKKFYYFTND